MRAEKIRELIDSLDCLACERAKEIMDKGVCCFKCEDEYRLEKYIEKELEELERLAAIGKRIENGNNEILKSCSQ